MWHKRGREGKLSMRSAVYGVFHLRPLTLPAGLCLLSALAGCALPGQSDMSHSSHPTATTQPTATPLPGPMTVTLVSEQHGTLASEQQGTLASEQQGTQAAQNVTLTVTVTITNHATQPIGIAAEGEPCQALPFSFFLLDRAGHTVTHLLGDGGCLMADANAVHDLATIGVGQAHSWQIGFHLFLEGWLQPGPYTLSAQNVIWHEGPISNTGVMPGLHGVASGQLPITIY